MHLGLHQWIGIAAGAGTFIGILAKPFVEETFGWILRRFFKGIESRLDPTAVEHERLSVALAREQERRIATERQRDALAVQLQDNGFHPVFPTSRGGHPRSSGPSSPPS